MSTGKKDSAQDEKIEDAQSENLDKSGGQRGSEQEYVTKEEFLAIQKSLDALNRNLQSEKDRAVKKTNERLNGIENGIKEVLQKAAKENLSVTDLLSQVEQQEEVDFRQTIKTLADSLKTGSLGQSSHGSEQSKGVDISVVLSELELDPEDLRVKDFSTKKFASAEEAYREGAKLVKTITSKQPTDADTPGNVNERQKAASKQEQLMAEYEKGAANLRGQALVNFKMQMRKKGLSIF